MSRYDREPTEPDDIGRYVDVEAIAPKHEGFSEAEIRMFFDEYAEGTGAFSIGLSLGWSPAKIKRFEGVAEFQDLMDAFDERLNESIEKAVHKAARLGNVAAQKLWLYNKASKRGWSDTRNIRLEAQAKTEVVVSVRDGVLEGMRAGVLEGGEASLAALQAGIYDDVVDAEVVE